MRSRRAKPGVYIGWQVSTGHAFGKKRPIWSGNVPRRNDDEVTLQELAEQIGVHRQTVYGWLRRGKLKGRIVEVGIQRIWLVSLSPISRGNRTGESS